MTYDFISNYLIWTNDMTDAPSFHQELAGLTALATAIGSVKIAFKQIVQPNLCINILGRTFLERKTTGTLNCLKQVIPQNLVLDVVTFSPESIQTIIQSHNGEGLLIIDEYGLFLRNVERRDFMAGTDRLLMQFYDGRPLIKGTYSNPVNIKDPYVNVFTLSTFSTFVENTKAWQITSGLMGRQIHAYAERDSYLDPKMLTNEDVQRLGELRKDMENYVKNRRSSATFEPDAMNILLEYKKKVDEECMRRNDETYSGIVGRYAGDYSVKFSLLYQMSMTNPENLALQIVIGKDAVERAIQLTNRCINVAMQEVVFHITANIMERAYRHIVEIAFKSSNGYCGRRELMHKMKVYTDEMDRIIMTLENQGDIIVEYPPSTSKGGRPAEMYKPVRETREIAKEHLQEVRV